MVRKTPRSKRSKRSSKKQSEPIKIIKEHSDEDDHEFEEDELEDEEIETLIDELNELNEAQKDEAVHNQYVAALTHSEEELLESRSISIDDEQDHEETPLTREDTPNDKVSSKSKAHSKENPGPTRIPENWYLNELTPRSTVNDSSDESTCDLEADMDFKFCSLAGMPLITAFVAAIVFVLLVEFEIIDLSKIF